MQHQHAISIQSESTFLFFLLLIAFSCNKDGGDTPPPPAEKFTVVVDNNYTGLGSQEAAWLSDEDGEVRAFKWLMGRDTAHLVVPDAELDERFDLTLFRLTALAGQGTNDSSFQLRTLQNVGHKATAVMQDNVLEKPINLTVIFQNIASLEDVFFSDALTFQEPKASTNYIGQYLAYHTGQTWLRVKANGNPIWQYVYADGLDGDTKQIVVEDVNILPDLFDPKPHDLHLPFLAYWDYGVFAVSDRAANKFLPIGQERRAPGGAFPEFDAAEIYQPKVANIAKDGYRLRIQGADGDFTYYVDRFYPLLPDSLPSLDFNIEATAVSGPRIASVFCSGNFQNLTFTRQYNEGLVDAVWEVNVKPVPNGVVSYRLPNFPPEIQQVFPTIAAYPFQGKVQARAEQFQQLGSYDAVLQKLLENDNPLWRTEGGMLGSGLEF